MDNRVTRANLDGADRVLALGLAGFGVYHLALAALMAFAPDTFFAEIGPFGVQNDHYIRDVASYNAAVGVVLLVALRYRTWRLPVLVFLLIQFALHAVNHLVDIDAADPESVGVVDFVGLTVATALLAGMVALASRRA